ncbi:DUF647-domain-containing protein [Auricularia subglabra TFB-10046 SS5]|uniref:DUF647-domain-containing protein n=1 Tax=Auricularia subglabra (strain TFB-10046 / SS5) TaxID=717982 RepID=J0LDW3_AURST|nr:DUF647-domain-containing protein [Auricularia subglabra TFB-10046 SS5]
MFDSLQAFFSEIAGLLAARAVLTGLGVGDAGATATGAVLLKIIQDTCGRVATILSAWKLGPMLEPECKQWRLAADLFNDAGIILECLSPTLPHTMKISLLCVARVVRSLCGVSAGGAKAALSQHFVGPGGSIADINAKESSQETVVALIGMLVGSMIVPRITSFEGTWTALLFLIGVHLYANWRGVRAVAMLTLNRQRATIVLGELIQRGRVLSPEQVRQRESVFCRSSRLVLDGVTLGQCHIGVSLQHLLAQIARVHGPDRSGSALAGLMDRFASERYILHCCCRRKGKVSIIICLKRGVESRDMLRAWTHALVLAQRYSAIPASGEPDELVLEETTARARELFLGSISRLSNAGWKLDDCALLTTSDRRITVQNG